uniref:Uncharacterized protein n=1 Tax=Mola mola TaxID=94237 RepID=A0A3Q4C147_MOLML
MMSSELKWLIVIQLLLNEQALCRAPSPLALRNTLPPATDIHGALEETAKQEHQSLLGAKLQPGPPSLVAENEEWIRSAKRGNVSCEELLSASIFDDQSSSVFPQELLGLSLVPVLVVAGCPQEAHALVLKLYSLLGVGDTEELLMELDNLMERKMSHSTSTSAASPPEMAKAGHYIDAVMFNIQQLATVGEKASEQEGHCEDWVIVNGTVLVGTAVQGDTGDLEEAVRSCDRLGVLCAGVTSVGPLKPGTYQAVLKKGSGILPSESTESECWIRRCSAEEEVSSRAASGPRIKRSPPRSCINKNEERVYSVVEWIPAVSTLYNLGTAVYYASVNCSETAKQRAILSAVDLGTDAIMVATGGTAGVAGYALGAGVKTGMKAGVRYLLNSMKQEDDVLVNQFSWEEGVITIE